MVAAILSPHLDDAVLSCWHLIAGPGDVAVINVFSGVPEPLGAVAWWDAVTGATNSAQRVRDRREEDRTALALAGRTAVNLDFLDQQYREQQQPLAPLVACISNLLVPGAEIHAPAAIGAHADHALVRAVALELRASGFAVSLYADIPHATPFGWPAWVTGKEAEAAKDRAAALWARSLARTEVAADSMTATVHELDPQAHARKLIAVNAYRTQLKGLAMLARWPLADRETLGYEVVWKLPAGPTTVAGREDRSAAPRP